VTVTRNNSSTQSHEDGGVELIAFFAPPASPAALQTFVTDRDGNTIWYYGSAGTSGLLYEVIVKRAFPGCHFFK
jgi:hypothetical protein